METNTPIFNIIKRLTLEQTSPRVKAFAKKNGLTIVTNEAAKTDENCFLHEEVLEMIGEAEDYLHACITGRSMNGEEYNVPMMKVDEAMNSSDFSIVFPRVISNILQEPKEPILYLTNFIAEPLNVPENAPLDFQFPCVGAVEAFEVSEGGGYQQQALSMAQHTVAVRMKKWGLMMSLNEEIMRQSMWNLLALNARLMTAAIHRRFESLLFGGLTTFATQVFDNDSADTTLRTTGVGSDGKTWNATFSYWDIVKMMGALLAKEYQATHMLAHPLMWPVLAQDPYMRANFFMGGQLGQGLWTREPQFDQQAIMPFNMQYVPYYAIPFHDKYTLTLSGSGLGASQTVSDIYVIDGKNSLYLAQRGGIEMDEIDDFYQDAKTMKARAYAGASVKDGGFAMTVAKNIRVERNFEPLFGVRTVSS